MTGATALKLMEQVWNRDLSGYDPDGPLPDVEPVTGTETIAPGRASVRMYRDPLGTARQWRQLAEAKRLSIRQLMIEVTARQSFVGSPATMAASMERFVRDQVCDGFILVPYLTPGGLDGFADQVVPLLQERGVFRPPTRAPPSASIWGWPRSTNHADASGPSSPTPGSNGVTGTRCRSRCWIWCRWHPEPAPPTPCTTPSIWPAGPRRWATAATGLPNTT